MTLHKLTGWWSFDSSTATLINTASGQRLRFTGFASDEPALGLRRTVNWRWARFDYEDSDVRYPVLIEQRALNQGGMYRPMIWRVDHWRSAALWSREPERPAYPPYGLWRRVDDCLIDALSVWPATNLTALRPGTVSLDAGWRNGRWAKDLHRRFRIDSSTDRPVVHLPFLIPLDAQAPSPWEFIAGRSEVDDSTRVDWGFIPDRDGRLWLPASARLDAQRINRPHLRSIDGQSFVVPLGKTGDAWRKLVPPESTGPIALLYIDQAVHGIGLSAANHYLRSWPYTAWSIGHGVGALDPAFIDRSSGEVIPLVLGQEFVGLDGPRRRRLLPNDLLLRLRSALIDAWPNWVREDIPDILPANKCSRTVDDLGVLATPVGGTENTIGLQVATSVEAVRDGFAHPEVFYHLDAPPEPPIGTHSRRWGWWDYDRESRSLINVLSGQRLTVDIGSGTAGISPAAGEKEYVLIYQDADLRLPLVLRIRHPDLYGQPPVWVVDYLSSIARWPAGPRTSLGWPLYGAWQRVDDCCVDALTCWPDTEELGLSPPKIHTVGGYLNGAWTVDLIHEAWVFSTTDLTQVVPEQGPLLHPYHRPAPAWRYVDTPTVAQKAFLAHVVMRADGRQFLPADVALEGFQSLVPYVVRVDGRAVFFPLQMRSTLYRGEDYVPTAAFMYVDDDILVEVTVNKSDYRGIWEFGPFWRPVVGVRSESPAADVAALLPSLAVWDGRAETMSVAQRERMPLALWDRMSRTLVDICLSWTGSEQRLLDDPHVLAEHAKRATVPDHATSGIRLDRGSGVHLNGGFVAGAPCYSSNHNFYTLDQGATRAGRIEPMVRRLVTDRR